MLSLLEVIQKTADFFSKKTLESPRLNAELLIGHALGLKRMQLYLQFERVLSESELESIRPLVKRRGQREPLQYILGETEWSGLRLKVDRRALIPRPETEMLIELLLSFIEKPPSTILDMGTGNGAIALALAKKYSNTKVFAIDQSQEALELAKENADALCVADQVSFLRSNWFEAVPSCVGFDVIVSNPPYLTESETEAAEPEVRAYEPTAALVSDEDGMADILKIISGAPAFLNAGGLLALETGIDQHSILKTRLQAAGFVRIESRQDLTGRDRFMFAWR